MDVLQTIHDLENYLGVDLDMDVSFEIADYLNDDPMDTEPGYLAELFNLNH